PLDQQAAVVAGLHLEIGDGPDQLGQAGEAVVAGREARYGLGPLAEFGERGITLLVALGRLVGRPQHLQQLLVDRPLALGGGRLLEAIFVVRKRERADVEETRTGL